MKATAESKLILLCWRGKDMNGATITSLMALTHHLMYNLGFRVKVLNSRGAYLHNLTRKLWQATTVCDPKAGPFVGQDDLKCYHRILMFDNDMMFTSEDFDKLYAADKDIISGVYVTGDGRNMIHMEVGDGVDQLLKTSCVPEGEEPVEMGSVGWGFTMLKPGVLEGFAAPWCYYPVVQEMDQEEVDSLWTECRKLDTPKEQVVEFILRTLTNLFGEDVGFCVNARRAGFKVYVHPDVILSHFKVMQVDPFMSVNMLEMYRRAIDIEAAKEKPVVKKKEG